MSVTGEPGIGKSRLLLGGASATETGSASSRGAASPTRIRSRTGRSRDLLREWLGVGASTRETRVRVELKAEIAHLFGADADEAYPFFASPLGLTLEPDAAQRIHELNRESIHTRTFEVFYELVRKLADERPLCLVFEDLHWADDSTLELLESLLGVTEESAVGLFLLYRSERELGSWRLGERARQQYPHRYREIEVATAARRDPRLAVGAAGGEIPDAAAELLAERSGGNPFFLEEAIRDLVERGALQRDNAGGGSRSVRTSSSFRRSSRAPSRLGSTASTRPPATWSRSQRSSAALRSPAPREARPPGAAFARSNRAPAS